jgi:hypothetical protein
MHWVFIAFVPRTYLYVFVSFLPDAMARSSHWKPKQGSLDPGSGSTPSSYRPQWESGQSKTMGPYI